MAVSDLTPHLQFLRKLLELEMKQQYRNRVIAGGLYASFHARFDQLEFDEASAASAQSILSYLRRYERASTTEEREQIAAIMLRRLEATDARARGQSSVAVPSANLPQVDLPVDRSSSCEVPDQSAAWNHPAQRPEVLLRPPSAHPPAPIPHIMEQDPQELSQESVLLASDDESTDEDPSVQHEAPVSLDVSAAESLHVRVQEQPRLETLGITTLRSAIEYWPRDHYDYSAPVRINRMRPDMQTTLIGTLRSVDMRRLPNRNIQVVEAKVADQTGVITITWFNQPYLIKTLKPRIGQEIAISGKVELYGGKLQLVPRDVEFPADDAAGVHTRGIVPVYPAAEGIGQRWLRTLVKRALDTGLRSVEDPLPEELRQEFRLPERRAAIRRFHFPTSMEIRDRARTRLALDELLMIQLGMLQRKRQWQSESVGRAIVTDQALLDSFRAGLPFTLTGAQERALAAILQDMSSAVPMSRLLQGDVGSGKTVVAAAALLLCARSGMQGAIMAPTEILAEQHARTLSRMLEPHGVKVAMLTGSLTKAQRARLYLDAVEGRVQVLAGTHALIQEGFKFKELGLAIVDEQHRFGVVQRAALKGKGYNPHLLVMTATPIPRTLTLTMYGDLDVSVIDERPPNRQPVQTNWLSLDKQAYTLIREQVSAGRQAYIVCPLVEESEALEAKAAVVEEQRLQQEIFPDLRLGLLHGKLRPQEKDAVLGRFRDGEIDILVATSVVEVGIDVPNATVMVVQDAQRFGLAQLHQFRGRVGRGAAQSYCILLAAANNPVARERLQALCETDDGFKLAEEDLRLRGPGEFWGTRQSGLPELQVAQVTDTATLEVARKIAEVVLADDPQLALPQHALLSDSVRRFWERAAEPS